MTGGEVLKREMKAKGITVDALAALSGVTASAVAQYRSGRIKFPSRDVLEAIDQALDTGSTVLAAYGFSPPTDAALELSKLRERMAELDAQVQQQAAAIADLSAAVERLQRPPRRSAGGSR